MMEGKLPNEEKYRIGHGNLLVVTSDDFKRIIEDATEGQKTMEYRGSFPFLVKTAKPVIEEQKDSRNLKEILSDYFQVDVIFVFAENDRSLVYIAVK